MKRENNEHRNLAIEELDDHFSAADLVGGEHNFDSTEIVDAILDAAKAEAIEYFKGWITKEIRSTRDAPDPSSSPQTPPENVSDPAKESGPQTIQRPTKMSLRERIERVCGSYWVDAPDAPDSQWTSVDDRLPATAKPIPVMVYAPHTHTQVWVTWFDHISRVFYGCEEWVNPVTHWMLLPKPPEVKAEEKAEKINEMVEVELIAVDPEDSACRMMPVKTVRIMMPVDRDFSSWPRVLIWNNCTYLKRQWATDAPGEGISGKIRYEKVASKYVH